MNGINVLTAAPNTQTDAEFIMMTAYAEVETAVEAIKLGAFDYLRKPLEPEELLLVIDRALEQRRLRREIASLRRQVPRGPRARIIGRSKALERLFDLIDQPSFRAEAAGLPGYDLSVAGHVSTAEG